MIAKTLLFLLVFSPLSALAQVYHCKGANGPVYSQIPCDTNAERLTAYDPVAEPDEPSKPGSTKARLICLARSARKLMKMTASLSWTPA